MEIFESNTYWKLTSPRQDLAAISEYKQIHLTCTTPPGAVTIDTIDSIVINSTQPILRKFS